MKNTAITTRMETQLAFPHPPEPTRRKKSPFSCVKLWSLTTVSQAAETAILWGC
jgi:hypothetical protein